MRILEFLRDIWPSIVIGTVGIIIGERVLPWFAQKPSEPEPDPEPYGDWPAPPDRRGE